MPSAPRLALADQLSALQGQFAALHAAHPRMCHATVEGDAVHDCAATREYLRDAIAAAQWPPATQDDRPTQPLSPFGFYFAPAAPDVERFDALAGDVAAVLEAVGGDVVDELAASPWSPDRWGLMAEMYGHGEALLAAAHAAAEAAGDTLAMPHRGRLAPTDDSSEPEALLLPDGCRIPHGFVPRSNADPEAYTFDELLQDLEAGAIGDVVVSRTGVYQVAQRGLSLLIATLRGGTDTAAAVPEEKRLTPAQQAEALGIIGRPAYERTRTTQDVRREAIAAGLRVRTVTVGTATCVHADDWSAVVRWYQGGQKVATPAHRAGRRWFHCGGCGETAVVSEGTTPTKCAKCGSVAKFKPLPVPNR